MQLDIITPDKSIYSGQVKLVRLPGCLGSFEVLNHHAPIISTLDKGKVKIITPKGDETLIEIPGGVVEVWDNNITVLAEKG